MNLSRVGLATVTMAWLAMTTAAAPIPTRGPESQGPISDFLRLRDKLPQTPPPRAVQLREAGEVFDVQRTSTRYVPVTRMTMVGEGGKRVAVPEVVMVPVYESHNERVALKDCKIFAVARGGKLEAVEHKTAAKSLRKSAVVLVGESTEVDPRHLELIESGTLYLVLPPGAPAPALPPPKLPRPRDK